MRRSALGRFLAIAAASLAAWPFAGCAIMFAPAVTGPINEAQTWKWNYPRPRPTDAPPLISGDLAVEELADLRSGTDEDSLRLIIPFVWSIRRSWRLPTSKFVVNLGYCANMVATSEITAAVADEIAAASLFRGVHRGDEPPADFVLTGELRSSACVADVYAYGLSILAILPWVFGAPVSKSTNELDIHLTLRRTTTRDVVWSYDLSTSDWRSYSIYSSRLMFRYDALLHAAMPSLLASLRAALIEESVQSKPP